MFDRIANSFALARSSWQVLRLDKELIVFPILSGIGCLLVLAGFATPFALYPQLLGLEQAADGVRAQTPPWFWVVVFAYYFCNYFLVVFFNAALISCALIRFNGGNPTLADGLGAAGSRLPQILAWALVSATVGVLLKAVENAHEKAGQFISALLGTAWSVMTYFVVPVLVVENVGPFKAVGESLRILRKTWGEALVGNMGLGLFVFLLMLPAVALAVLGAVVSASVPAVGVALFLLAGVYFLLWLAVGPALNGIYLAALYHYATLNEIPSGFDRKALRQAFVPKS
jgi:hypothetical protein